MFFSEVILATVANGQEVDWCKNAAVTLNFLFTFLLPFFASQFIKGFSNLVKLAKKFFFEKLLIRHPRTVLNFQLA